MEHRETDLGKQINPAPQHGREALPVCPRKGNDCIALCKEVNGFQASFEEFVLQTPLIHTSHIRLIQLSFSVISLQLIFLFLFQLAMKHKC